MGAKVLIIFIFIFISPLLASTVLSDDKTPNQSTSIGYVDMGWLRKGHPLSLLELNKHYLQFPHTMNENLKRCKTNIDKCHALTNYVTDELFDIIENTSIALNKVFPGTYLVYGDGSHKNGGINIGHKSHQSGRDIDIHLFSCIIDNRVCVPTPLKLYYKMTKMVAFDKKGFSKRVHANVKGEYFEEGFFRFDLARNLEFLRILYENYGDDVQSIFLNHSLKKLLLDFAKSINRDSEFIKWVDSKVEILSTPPHNNHFHLRIYCSKEDAKKGCYNKLRY